MALQIVGVNGEGWTGGVVTAVSCDYVFILRAWFIHVFIYLYYFIVCLLFIVMLSSHTQPYLIRREDHAL